MIRPRVHDAKLSQQTLLDYMREYKYPYLDNHAESIEYAFVFTCEHKDEIAGFIWCYLHDDDGTEWTCHVLAVPKYQKRFFNRRMVNTALSVAWASGVDRIIVENSQMDLLLRVGGEMRDGQAVLELPHKWS